MSFPTTLGFTLGLGESDSRNGLVQSWRTKRKKANVFREETKRDKVTEGKEMSSSPLTPVAYMWRSWLSPGEFGRNVFQTQKQSKDKEGCQRRWQSGAACVMPEEHLKLKETWDIIYDPPHSLIFHMRKLKPRKAVTSPKS